MFVDDHGRNWCRWSAASIRKKKGEKWEVFVAGVFQVFATYAEWDGLVNGRLREDG